MVEALRGLGVLALAYWALVIATLCALVPKHRELFKSFSEGEREAGLEQAPTWFRWAGLVILAFVLPAMVVRFAVQGRWK